MSHLPGAVTRLGWKEVWIVRRDADGHVYTEAPTESAAREIAGHVCGAPVTVVRVYPPSPQVIERGGAA